MAQPTLDQIAAAVKRPSSDLTPFNRLQAHIVLEGLFAGLESLHEQVQQYPQSQLDESPLALALLDLWTDMWRWCKEILAECIDKDAYGAVYRLKAYQAVIFALRAMVLCRSTSRAVTATSDVIEIMTKHWLNQEDLLTRGLPAGVINEESYSFTYSDLLKHFQEAGALNHDDVLKVAGGSADKIAQRSVKCLRDQLSRDEPRLSGVALNVTIMQHLSWLSDSLDLRYAFLCAGSMQQLVGALAVLSDIDPLVSVGVFEGVFVCYEGIMNGLMAPNGPRWAVKALDAGLLAAVAKSGRVLQVLHPEEAEQCGTLCTDLLAPLFLHYSVARSVSRSLKDPTVTSLLDKVEGPLKAPLKSFRDFVTPLLRVWFDPLEAKSSTDADARDSIPCSNAACGKKPGLGAMRKCTGCMVRMYCSQRCQTADWPEHKVMCRALQKDIRNGHTIGLDDYDMQWAITLAGANFVFQKKRIKSIISTRYPSSPAEALYIIADYTHVPLQMDVGELSSLTAEERENFTSSREYKEAQDKKSLQAVKVTIGLPERNRNKSIYAMVPRET